MAARPSPWKWSSSVELQRALGILRAGAKLTISVCILAGAPFADANEPARRAANQFVQADGPRSGPPARSGTVSGLFKDFLEWRVYDAADGPSYIVIRVLTNRLPAEMPERLRRTLDAHLPAEAMEGTQKAYARLDAGDVIVARKRAGRGSVLAVNDTQVARTHSEALVQDLARYFSEQPRGGQNSRANGPR